MFPFILCVMVSIASSKVRDWSIPCVISYRSHLLDMIIVVLYLWSDDNSRNVNPDLSDYSLEIKPKVKVRLKKKDVSIFVIKLLKPFRRIIIKKPLIDMNLRFYKKSFLLTDREMVA